MPGRTYLKLLSALAFLWLVTTAAAAQSFDGEWEKKMWEEANRERVKRGIAPLRWNDKLRDSARKHVLIVAQRKQLSHRFPGQAKAGDRIAAEGLSFDASAENIAFATHPEDLHDGLMRSPGHRANILGAKYNALGIGVVKGNNGYYAVQNFARATSEAGSAEAEERVAEAINAHRREKGMLPASIAKDAALRKAACGMAAADELATRALPRRESTTGVLVFTATEPENVPARSLELATQPRFRNAYIGVCRARSKTYPGGVYWVGITY